MPLDLHLIEIGLKTYLRLKQQLDTPKDTTRIQGHLSYWDSLQTNAKPLWQADDTCNEAQWFKQYQVNMNSLDGQQKHITPSEITVYTCFIWSEWRLTVIAATVRIALVDILDLSEVDIPAGGFLYPTVGWG